MALISNSTKSIQVFCSGIADEMPLNVKNYLTMFKSKKNCNVSWPRIYLYKLSDVLGVSNSQQSCIVFVQESYNYVMLSTRVKFYTKTLWILVSNWAANKYIRSETIWLHVYQLHNTKSIRKADLLLALLTALKIWSNCSWKHTVWYLAISSATHYTYNGFRTVYNLRSQNSRPCVLTAQFND